MRNLKKLAGLAVLATTLSSTSLSVMGQGISASDQERCTNNRNAIQYYAKQGSEFARLYLVKTKEEFYRRLYSELNQAIPNMRNSIIQYGDRRAKAEQMGLSWNTAWEVDDDGYRRAMRGRLQELLDKAGKYSNAAEIRADLENADRQIAYHTKQLSAWRCDADPNSRATTSDADELSYDADAGANDLTGSYPTRGFGDSNTVDEWIPFSVRFPPVGRPIKSATLWISLKPIGQLTDTDALGLKGSDGKVYWTPIPFKNLLREFQYVSVKITQPAVIDALKGGRLVGVIQDDSAVTGVKLVIQLDRTIGANAQDDAASQPPPNNNIPSPGATVSGRWSGSWDNSRGERGTGAINIREDANGVVTGDENGWRIENGRRSGNVLTWEYRGRNNGCRDYKVRFEVTADGNTANGIYAVTDKCGKMVYTGRYLNFRKQT
jgi:hypothetical protein